MIAPAAGDRPMPVTPTRRSLLARDTLARRLLPTLAASRVIGGAFGSVSPRLDVSCAFARGGGPGGGGGGGGAKRPPPPPPPKKGGSASGGGQAGGTGGSGGSGGSGGEKE